MVNTPRYLMRLATKVESCPQFRSCCIDLPNHFSSIGVRCTMYAHDVKIYKRIENDGDV